jgi:broad specificity phosphatase PhoE
VIIYNCRHGCREEDGSDIVKPVRLTDIGRTQAKDLGNFLATFGIQCVLSSPKIRAIETALPLAAKIGLSVEVWPILCEYNSFGPYDYNAAEIIKIGAVIKSERTLPNTPKSEDRPFAYARAIEAIKQIRALNLERVAVFAHCTFNSLFIDAWLGVDCPTEHDKYRQHEACINILEDGKEPQIGMCYTNAI